MNFVTCGLLTSAVLAAGLVSAGLTAPSAAAESVGPVRPDMQAHAYPGESYAQYRRYGYGRGYYGRGYRRGYGYGGAAAAGIAGLAAGALIGGAIASQQPAPAYGYGPGAPVGNVYGHDPRAVQYCAGRYRSYDPASGTFLASDGGRYPCP